MIRAPNRYSPLQHPERARQRRDAVLRRMRELGMIDDAALRAALARRTEPRGAAGAVSFAPYFLDYARTAIGPDAGDAGGDPRVYTTLDPILQRAAERAVSRELERLERAHPGLRRAPGDRLQAALVALDPASGAIRALVGGRDYGDSPFNRATRARRQPGSAFKPFVFLAALRRGPAGAPPVITSASLVEDAPVALELSQEEWAPRNYDDRFEGVVTVRRALEQSSNAVAVRLAQAVGLERVIRTARDVGFRSRMAPVPALALGAFEVTPLELATAYATLANGGTPVRPHGVAGPGRGPGPAARATGLAPEEAYLLTHLLRGVVDRGTGATVRALGLGGAVAGKTGTTNDTRDAWFAGYSPRLVAVVWVGFDDGAPIGLSGAQAALPLWTAFMRAAGELEEPGDFTVPERIAFRAGCDDDGLDVFLALTAPDDPCGVPAAPPVPGSLPPSPAWSVMTPRVPGAPGSPLAMPPPPRAGPPPSRVPPEFRGSDR
jgi:penicillin-binding protein 1B